MNKTAIVNLTKSTVEIAPTDLELFHDYLGGRGYASKLLFDLVGVDADPLGPDNVIIFSIGSFGGSVWPTSGRGHVTFKSPATDAYGHANSGGFFGAELAQTGFDAVVVVGKADVPSYLYINDGTIEIRSAEKLWGMEVGAASDVLEPMGRVALIGPAGENLVKIAAIINDRSRAAARGGGGAVMGSKNLKAVVVKGDKRRGFPEKFVAIGKRNFKRIKDDFRLETLNRFGTSILLDIQNKSGSLPSKNHQTVQVDDVRKLQATTLHKYVLKGKGCYACPVKCGRVSEVPDGRYSCKTGGPEYESVAAIGPMTLVDDIEAIIYANMRCNELGLDTISAGGTIAFAMECHQKGLLSDGDVSLQWGDTECVLALLEMIAHRQGLGNTLAEGSLRAAALIGPGAEQYAMQVKGLELPRQDPRVAKGFGLGHAVSNRGADHLYGLPTIDAANMRDVAERYFDADIIDDLLDTQKEEYKPDEVVLGENYCAVIDSVGICKLISAENHCLKPEDIAEGLSALWGKPWTAEDVLRAGERIVNLERMFNVLHGYSRKNDYLPERFTQEAVDVFKFSVDSLSGEMRRSEKPVIEAAILKEFDSMLDRYYRLRNWGSDGIPSPEVLSRLGLSWISHE